MKANELMIGDWVYYQHTEDGVTPYKEAIRIEADDLTCDDCILEAHYNPIPLTPEILDKNEFTKSEWYGVRKIISDGYELRITPWRVVVLFLNEDGSDKEEFSFPRPKYVYQLQHALRLCGIDKEIVL